jgi:thiol-disulfide isomerase/thioredoxin
MNVNDIFERLHLPVESRLPEFAGATTWLNSPPLSSNDLHGKVVLADFGTFTCINWIRTLPYVRAWNERYRDSGLVTIGIQTPEFEMEHDVDRVRQSLDAMQVDYPVAVDNDYAIWNAFANQYWPALYVADADGHIRHHHYGEGGYEKSERVIRHLLNQAGTSELPDPAVVAPDGIEAAADWHNVRSQETYVGWARSEGFASPGGASFDESRTYMLPPRLRTNEWALVGDWTIGREEGTANQPGARVVYQFHARDLNLILTPPDAGAARFRVTLDGERPGAAHGLDVDEDGNGVASDARLYQLIRQPGPIKDRKFEIEFHDAGIAALCFTFG